MVVRVTAFKHRRTRTLPYKTGIIPLRFLRYSQVFDETGCRVQEQAHQFVSRVDRICQDAPSAPLSYVNPARSPRLSPTC